MLGSRRPLLVLPLLSLVLVAAACGSGSSMSLDPVASAASKTESASTYRAEFTASMTVAGQSFSFSGDGVVDEAHGAARLTMDLSSFGLPKGGDAEMVLVDGVMYMRLALLAQELPKGKSWLKIDLAKTASAMGLDLGSLRGVDPHQSLDQLLAAGDTEKLGTDTVQGEQMTHYHAVVDAANDAGLTPSQKAALAKALRGMSGRMPVDVWIDDSGRVRRETLDFDYGKALQNAHMSMTMDFSDFGIDASIAAPPADEVIDLTTLATGALTQSNDAWSAKAGAICQKVFRDAQALAGTTEPTTIDAKRAYAQSMEPLERGEAQAIAAIGPQPTAAEQKAVSALHDDLDELHAALAVKDDSQRFEQAFRTWYDDRRTLDAFAAAGVADCAG